MVEGTYNYWPTLVSALPTLCPLAYASSPLLEYVLLDTVNGNNIFHKSRFI